MKAKCIICGIIDELAKEEQTHATFIVERTKKAIDYINVLTLLRGPTCTNDKKHVFTFHEDFMKDISEVVDFVKITQESIDEKNNKENELKAKAKSLYDEHRKIVSELADVIENRNANIDKLEVWKNKFKDIAGTDNIELWK